MPPNDRRGTRRHLTRYRRHLRCASLRPKRKISATRKTRWRHRDDVGGGRPDGRQQTRRGVAGAARGGSRTRRRERERPCRSGTQGRGRGRRRTTGRRTTGRRVTRCSQSAVPAFVDSTGALFGFLWATIEDEAFIAALDRGEQFEKGETVKCAVRVRQWDNGEDDFRSECTIESDLEHRSSSCRLSVISPHRSYHNIPEYD